jgi:hypothetical protein
MSADDVSKLLGMLGASAPQAADTTPAQDTSKATTNAGGVDGSAASGGGGGGGKGAGGGDGGVAFPVIDFAAIEDLLKATEAVVPK